MVVENTCASMENVIDPSMVVDIDIKNKDGYHNMLEKQEEKINVCETVNESLMDSVAQEPVVIVDEPQEPSITIDMSQEPDVIT
ncbi:hypothetical protein L7F22_017333, partial [Adiantum nelumboides]|nr:hypothetical protein [Adiantum nelumboides]